MLLGFFEMVLYFTNTGVRKAGVARNAILYIPGHWWMFKLSSAVAITFVLVMFLRGRPRVCTVSVVRCSLARCPFVCMDRTASKNPSGRGEGRGKRGEGRRAKKSALRQSTQRRASTSRSIEFLL